MTADGVEHLTRRAAGPRDKRHRAGQCIAIDDAVIRIDRLADHWDKATYKLKEVEQATAGVVGGFVGMRAIAVAVPTHWIFVIQTRAAATICTAPRPLVNGIATYAAADT